MKKIPVFVLGVFITVCCCAQSDLDAKTDSIETEGKKLYRSEMASWNGTDIFLEKYKEQRQNIGGYLSYAYKDSTRCIFFSKGEAPVVLATICFDGTYLPNNAQVDATLRDFTVDETKLYTIRKKALSEINSDTLFKTYKKTNLNLIPLIDGGEKKVYVLTGPEENGLMIFGNDYLLTFDSANNLLMKKQLHKNIITVNYSNTGGQQVVAAMHTHLPETGEFMTATDVCTLMLYEKYAKWQQYMVISAGYISIWDCEKNTLLILTMAAWDRINKDQEKRHKK